jgi:hypothetical protein
VTAAAGLYRWLPNFADKVSMKERVRAGISFRPGNTPHSSVRSRMMGLTASLQDPAPALRKIEELEVQRKVFAAEIASLEREQGVNAGLATITEPAVKQLLGGVVEEMHLMRREALKDMLASLAEKVVLDPATLECQIHYRIGIDGRNELASPRGFESNSGAILVASWGTLAARAPRSNSQGLDESVSKE